MEKNKTKGNKMEAALKQLLFELQDITQESIDLNARYFKTPAFTEAVKERLQMILDGKV